MKRARSRLWATAAATTIGLAAASGALAGEFGTRCQKHYDGNWQVELSSMYDRCGGFNDRMNDNNTQMFYFQLNGGSGFRWNDGSAAAGGVETADLFYVGTHGGVNDTDAVLALKEQNSFAFSTQWRFGDNSNQVAIYSQYSCKTLTIDANAFARWVNPFKGGLYLATGSHGIVYDGWTTDDTGYDYADDLTHGKTVKWAWFDGNSDWWADQDVAIYASSSGSLASCQTRRDSMTGQNINNFTRLRDGNMNRICASWISE
jgi:hypothetical protein